MKKLLVVDGHSIINRAFYGVRMLSNEKGVATNAVYGFLKILFKHMNEIKPDAVCVAFDEKRETFRNKLYTDYKANRSGMPEELKAQVPLLKQILSVLKIPFLSKEGYEGDDIIGTISRMCEDRGSECRILTGDRDFLQLATDRTIIVIVTTQKGKSAVVKYGKREIEEIYKIEPVKFIEIKSLMGDKSDNIPGVPGIGEKKALELVSLYGSVDDIYSRIDEIPFGLQKKLIAGKSSAYLSRELAAIKRDVPLNAELADFILKDYDSKEVLDIFRELNFSSLIKYLNLEYAKEEAHDYKVIPLDELKKKIDSEFRYIMEESESGGILIALPGFVSYADDAAQLRDIFEDEKISKISHGVMENIILLHKCGVDFENIGFDTKIAAYVIEPDDSNYGLEALAVKYLGYTIDSKTQEQRVAEYAIAVSKLYDYFKSEIKIRNQEKLFYEIEIPVIKVISYMNIHGICVDKNQLMQLDSVIKQGIDETAKCIYAEAGEQFNINSTRQLGEILFEKLGMPVIRRNKMGYSTNMEVLSKLRGEGEIIDYLIQYRHFVKLKSSYIDGLLGCIDRDGLVHSTFNQTSASTGRISSINPNLQNIPTKYTIGGELRKIFVPRSADNVFITADYSQIELRILAHISKDENMIDAFMDDADIHRRTASTIFNVPLSEVTHEMRLKAKVVNFGIIYGMSDFSLAKEINTSRADAAEYIKSYMNYYKRVREYVRRIVEECKEKFYVSTLFGRRRYIREINEKNSNKLKAASRMAVNAPIQGTAADIIKIAMCGVYSAFESEGIDAKIVLQIYDELIVEVPKRQLDSATQIVKHEMESAVQLSVPLKVDIGVGENWHDAK